MSKKLIAEAIGTATLVILGCGTAMLVGCDAAAGGGYILTALAFPEVFSGLVFQDVLNCHGSTGSRKGGTVAQIAVSKGAVVETGTPLVVIA